MRIFSIVSFIIFMFAGDAFAKGIITFEKVVFLGESNGGPKTWTQLRFRVISPKNGIYRVYSKNWAEFTIDADFNNNYLRSDLRYRNDWLGINKFSSSNKADMYVGSRPPTTKQKSDLAMLTANEKVMAAWIIANSDELIEFALNSGKYISSPSRKKWEFLAKNDVFERNIRKNLGPYYRKKIADYDGHAKHTRLALERMIQPSLKKLGYYNGKVDGLWGQQTVAALKKFELEYNLFPDGVNYGKERRLLVKLADEADQYSDVSKVKEREDKSRKAIDKLNQQLSEQIKKTNDAERKAEERYQTILKLNNKISALGKTELSGSLKSGLEEEIVKWRAKAAQQEDLAKGRYDQIRSLYQKIRDLKLEIADLKKLSRSNELKSKLQDEILSWRSKAAKQEDLAKRRYSLITALNQQISVLKQDLNKSISQSSLAETLNDRVRELENELKIASKQRSDAVNKYRKRKVELVQKHQLEIDVIQVGLKKEIRDLKSQLAEAKAGRAGLTKFELNEEWADLERYLAVQQVRFCQILVNYEEEAKNAAESRNQLRQNLVATNRDDDIAALLPNGNYKDWVAKVVEIYAIPTGDAAFVLRLPCDVTFGSGKLPKGGGQTGEYAATAEYGGIIYNQLAQLAEGDTVLISGKILTYADIGNKNQRLNFVTTLINNQKFKSSKVIDRFAPDYFSSITYLSKL